MKLFLGKRGGAVNVFLTIILVPMIVVSCLLVDVSRSRLAASVVSSAGDLTLNTVLTQYDPIINDYYGLLASCQDVDKFLDVADDYFQACIASQGFEGSDARMLANSVRSSFEEGGIVDLLQIAETEGSSFEVKPVANGNLANPALMKKEIVEFMKYRAPIDMIGDIFEKFKNSSNSLQNAEKDGELVNKKKEVYETEGTLVSQAMDVYEKLLKYKELNITKEDIEEMKTVLEGLRDRYLELHVKMTKDLYNTEGISFRSATINYSPNVSVSANQINNYIDNTAKAIREFISAARNLDNTYDRFPEYNGSVYKIQYLVTGVKILRQNDYYSEYANKATTLIRNMKQLTDAYNLLTEEERGKEYELTSYLGVDTSGNKSREMHFDSLNSQYEDLKQNYLYNTNAAYNEITEKLSEIQSDYGADMNPAETSQRLTEIYNEINKYYTKYESAFDIIGQATASLGSLKGTAEKYRNDFNAWSNHANSYSSSLADSDKAECQDDKTREILENVTPARVEALTNRLNKIKSLLGSLKAVIDDYKYNGHSVRSIKNYNDFRSASAVREDQISYIEEELNAYANSDRSFRFSVSDRLNTIQVTDNNNPAIHEVNTPELYTWLQNFFKNNNYEAERGEQAEGKKQDAENDKEEYENKYKNVEKNYGNVSGNAVEIKGQANLPSASYSAMSVGDIISTDISKISNFVSGLFSNLGGTLGQSAKNMRDELYTMDYVMKMFSYDTYENEGEFKLCGGGVNLTTPNLYESVEDRWTSTDKKDTFNKSLTNKLINSSNNAAYGSEVEYILYGKSNANSVKAAYTTIFAIRYVLNLPAEFSKNWSKGLVPEIALGIQAASYGVIPAALIKLIIILGLTAAESARDLKYLEKGMPIKLVKGENDIEISVEGSPKNPDKNPSPDAFYYSDYLSLLLFLNLSVGDQYAIYARIADVIQTNMKSVNSSEFLMKKAIVYYNASANLRVKPLMLELPIVSNAGFSTPGDGGWNSITYKSIKGY